MLRAPAWLGAVAAFSGVSLPPAEAHNGAVAVAFPVEGITLDGDLSDWPEDMGRYPIAHHTYGDPPGTASDVEGVFRVGYNLREGALYLAVEVEDESIVVDSAAGPAWDDRDGCVIDIDSTHARPQPLPAWSPPAVSTRSAVGGDVPVNLGTQAEVMVGRTAHSHRYEWRLILPLRPEMSLGLDVHVGDVDADSTASWVAWGSGLNTDLGDLILFPAAPHTGRLTGQVVWEAGGPAAGARVRVDALDAAAFWVQAVTDERGVYGADLPVGRYEVTLGFGRESTVGVDVEVRQDQTQDVPLVAPTPKGLVVAAGQGKRIKAGAGSRHGAWILLDALDGLAESRVLSLLQDRHGDLWFGTWDGGVCRYDGAEFTTFTTADGLASDHGRLHHGRPAGRLVVRHGWRGEPVRRQDLHDLHRPGRAGAR